MSKKGANMTLVMVHLLLFKTKMNHSISKAINGKGKSEQRESISQETTRAKAIDGQLRWYFSELTEEHLEFHHHQSFQDPPPPYLEDWDVFLISQPEFDSIQQYCQ